MGSDVDGKTWIDARPTAWDVNDMVPKPETEKRPDSCDHDVKPSEKHLFDFGKLHHPETVDVMSLPGCTWNGCGSKYNFLTLGSEHIRLRVPTTQNMLSSSLFMSKHSWVPGCQIVL